MDRIGVIVECHVAVDRLPICAQLRHGIVDLIAGIVIRGNAEGMGPAGSAQHSRIHDGAAVHHRDGNAALVGGGALPFLRDGDLLLCVFDIGDDIARCGGQLDGRCDDTVAGHRLLHGHISDIIAILVLGRQLYGGIAPAVPLGQLQRIHRRFRRVVDRRSVLGGAGHHIDVNGNRRAVRGRAAGGQPALGDGEALLLRIAGVPNDMGGIRGDLRAAHIDLAPLHRDRRLSVAEGRGNEAGRGLGLSQGICMAGRDVRNIDKAIFVGKYRSTAPSIRLRMGARCAVGIMHQRELCVFLRRSLLVRLQNKARSARFHAVDARSQELARLQIIWTGGPVPVRVRHHILQCS